MIDGQEIFKYCDNCAYYHVHWMDSDNATYINCCNPDSLNYGKYPAASDCCEEWYELSYDN